MDGAAGEESDAALRVTFDPRLKLEFHGSGSVHHSLAQVLLPLSGTRELALGWNATIGRVLVHRARQFPREPSEQLVARQARLLREGRENIGSDGLLELARRNLFVLARPHPGVDGLGMSRLLEAINEFRQPATEQRAGTGPTQRGGELPKQSAETSWRLGCSARPACALPTLGGALEHFGDLVPVLVASHGQQAQQGRHRRKSTAHSRAPFCRAGRLAG